MAEFQQVSQTKLAETVAASIRTAILHSELAPDELLPEETLARSFGVSRGPVREAIRQLELEGLVVTRRNRRALVARLTPEKLEEVFQIRLALETLAVRRVAKRATADELAKFEAVLAKMGSFNGKGMSIPQAVDLDLQFHDCLYECSGYALLRQLWSMLRPQIVLFLNSRNRHYPNYPYIILPEHKRIYAAIKARDPKRAVSLIRSHIAGAHEEMMVALPKGNAHKE
jgi:DNA-binding GntR family transcriptional regulator